MEKMRWECDLNIIKGSWIILSQIFIESTSWFSFFWHLRQTWPTSVPRTWPWRCRRSSSPPWPARARCRCSSMTPPARSWTSCTASPRSTRATSRRLTRSSRTWSRSRWRSASSSGTTGSAPTSWGWPRTSRRSCTRGRWRPSASTRYVFSHRVLTLRIQWFETNIMKSVENISSWTQINKYVENRWTETSRIITLCLRVDVFCICSSNFLWSVGFTLVQLQTQWLQQPVSGSASKTWQKLNRFISHFDFRFASKWKLGGKFSLQDY